MLSSKDLQVGVQVTFNDLCDITGVYILLKDFVQDIKTGGSGVIVAFGSEMPSVSSEYNGKLFTFYLPESNDDEEYYYNG